MNRSLLFASSVAAFLFGCAEAPPTRDVGVSPAASQQAFDGLVRMSAAPPSQWSRREVADAFGLQVSDLAPQPWAGQPDTVGRYETLRLSSLPFQVTIRLGYPEPWPAAAFGFTAGEEFPAMGATWQPLKDCVDAKQLQERLREIGWQLVRDIQPGLRKVRIFTRRWDGRDSQLVLRFAASVESDTPGLCVFGVDIRPGTEYRP